MTINLQDTADLFDTLAKLCRGYKTDTDKVKKALLSVAEGGVVKLQHALGVNADGVVGPATRGALEKIDIDNLLELLIDSVLSPKPPVPPIEPRPPQSPLNPYAEEYNRYFANMMINNDRFSSVSTVARNIKSYMARYQNVAAAVSVGYWPAIGIVHSLESGLDFATHLHNGDPLSARTVHVPVGRPAAGNPPFTWEESAIDALRMEHWDTWTDWSISGIAYLLEKYNGFGYRTHNIPSAYLWAASNIYTKGYFTSDGHFDPNAVSRQIGGMTIMKFLSENSV